MREVKVKQKWFLEGASFKQTSDKEDSRNKHTKKQAYKKNRTQIGGKRACHDVARGKRGERVGFRD